MKVEVDNLEDLMRVRKISISKLSELTDISEDTIRRRLKDHDWRMSEAESIKRVLNIPKNYVYLYFFEPLLEQDSKEVT